MKQREFALLVSVAVVVAYGLSPMLRVDFQCRVIFTCVRKSYVRK